jgi:hypothetical protein
MKPGAKRSVLPTKEGLTDYHHNHNFFVLFKPIHVTRSPTNFVLNISASVINLLKPSGNFTYHRV